MKISAVVFGLVGWAVPCHGAVLPHGIGAWAYNTSAGIDAAVTSYDAEAAATAQFQYFFPDYGSINVTGTNIQDFSISMYGSGPGMVSHYQTLLPGAKMMPILESGDGAIFSNWSAANLVLAADETAAAVTNAAATTGQAFAGVEIDLEPFSASQLPYYAQLRQILNAHGYLLSLFAGSGATSNPTVFSDVDFLSFSGYDLGPAAGQAISPASYGALLQSELSQALASAQSVGGYLLVGVPLAASTTEFESVGGGSCAPEVSGYSQNQYVSQAAAVLCENLSNPALLGAAVWALGDAAVYSGCSYEPSSPSAASWSALASYATMDCSTGASTSSGSSQAAFQVQSALAVPNPGAGQRSLCFSLSAEAVSGQVQVFTAGYTLVWRQDLPPADFSAGEHCVPFNPGALGLPPGVYYLMVRAAGPDGAQSSSTSAFVDL